MPTEEYIKRCRQKHNDLYDYPDNFIYKGGSHNITVICSKHGPFITNAGNHLYNGSGCPLCINTTEGKLYNWLNIYFPNLAESILTYME